MDLPQQAFFTWCPDQGFDPWEPLMAPYIQKDIDMTLALYDVLPKPESHSYTETTVVTGPFAFSTSQEESVEDWLLSKGYFIEWLDTIRIVSGSNRSRMLSHLRMTGARIYSIKTQVVTL